METAAVTLLRVLDRRGSMTRGLLNAHLAQTDRRWFTDALAALTKTGRVQFLDDRYIAAGPEQTA